MIHYLTGEAGSRTVAFIGILLAFAATCLTMYKCMDLLPKDQGREFAVDGKKSAGKPRGAGFLFVLVLLSYMVPFELISINLYAMMIQFGWIDSYLALIVPILPNGMIILLFRQKFMSFPDYFN